MIRFQKSKTHLKIILDISVEFFLFMLCKNQKLLKKSSLCLYLDLINVIISIK